jgi:hypothetical protein
MCATAKRRSTPRYAWLRAWTLMSETAALTGLGNRGLSWSRPRACSRYLARLATKRRRKRRREHSASDHRPQLCSFTNGRYRCRGLLPAAPPIQKEAAGCAVLLAIAPPPHWAHRRLENLSRTSRRMAAGAPALPILKILACSPVATAWRSVRQGSCLGETNGAGLESDALQEAATARTISENPE